MKTATFTSFPLTLFIALCGSIVLTTVEADQTQGVAAARQSSYDSIYIPTTSSQLKLRLELAADGPAKLYSATLQAAENGLELADFDDLRIMAKKYPNNANVLGAFCFAYDVASGGNSINWHKQPLKSYEDPAAFQEYERDLAEADKINPNSWTLDLVKADQKTFPINADRAGSLRLLRKAVTDGPDVPYTHCALALELMTYHTAEPQQLGKYRGDVQYFKPTQAEYEEAAREFSKAEKLKPIDSDAPWYLFLIYTGGLPDHEQALQSKRVFLSEVPPWHKLSPTTTKELDGVSDH